MYAFVAASIISSLLAAGFPYSMFSSIDPLKMWFFCSTSPILLRRYSVLYSLRSVPSRVMVPLSGS